MCILRQLKQGFSGDGKTLSGLVKAEQYGKNLAVEVSIINFAPLVDGEYYCILADGKGNTETLSLLGKSFFNLLTDLDITDGFCAVICYIKNEITPVAYGVNGEKNYDWKKILNATLPPSYYKKAEETATTDEVEKPALYDDESVAQENYYKEQDNERELFSEIDENAPTESGIETEKAQSGTCQTENDDAENIRHPFETDDDTYYRSVKAEIDALFSKYPKDDRLTSAFSCSEWVRVRGEAGAPQYLVGVLYEDGKASYICYALAAQDKDQPPEEIKKVCAFVPSSLFDDTKGFFVIFQSAASGECIKPKQA
jgi:hypothetical protein